MLSINLLRQCQTATERCETCPSEETTSFVATPSLFHVLALVLNLCSWQRRPLLTGGCRCHSMHCSIINIQNSSQCHTKCDLDFDSDFEDTATPPLFVYLLLADLILHVKTIDVQRRSNNSWSPNHHCPGWTKKHGESWNGRHRCQRRILKGKKRMNTWILFHRATHHKKTTIRTLI